MKYGIGSLIITCEICKTRYNSIEQAECPYCESKKSVNIQTYSRISNHLCQRISDMDGQDGTLYL